MVKESLLDHISIPSNNIHSYNTKLSPKSCASEYEKDIREHFMLEEQQLPRFDCILLGLGADGHTASLFPEDSDIEYIWNRSGPFKKFRQILKKNQCCPLGLWKGATLWKRSN